MAPTNHLRASFDSDHSTLATPTRSSEMFARPMAIHYSYQLAGRVAHFPHTLSRLNWLIFIGSIKATLGKMVYFVTRGKCGKILIILLNWFLASNTCVYELLNTSICKLK